MRARPGDQRGDVNDVDRRPYCVREVEEIAHNVEERFDGLAEQVTARDGHCRRRDEEGRYRPPTAARGESGTHDERTERIQSCDAEPESGQEQVDHRCHLSVVTRPRSR